MYCLELSVHIQAFDSGHTCSSSSIGKVYAAAVPLGRCAVIVIIKFAITRGFAVKPYILLQADLTVPLAG